VLSDEDRMSAKRRLLSVVGGRRWSESLSNERCRVLEHGGASLLREIRPLLGTERKSPSERRSR